MVGRVIEVRLEQLWKAYVSIVDTLDGIVIVVRPELENAFIPTRVIVEGIEIVWSKEQELNV